MATTVASSSAQLIAEGFRPVVPRDGVFEMRILSTPRGTISGYFDDIDEAALAIRAYDGKYTIYVTLNPVTPSLLARAANRLIEYAKQTTSDTDIVRRCWLPIDCDPVRPAGISSTDLEHELALTRTRDIRDYLTGALGWPEPMFADSGNGGHLLYAIDLPNDAQARDLVERCLKAASMLFTDGSVSVDETVFNAARIWKVYGTMACKGDSVPERPHRRAAILQSPEAMLTVTTEQLAQVAALLPEAKEEPTTNPSREGSTTPLDVEDRMSRWGLDVQRSKSWNGGTAYILARCPFNRDHTNLSAVVTRGATGRLGFACRHNSCAGKNWSALRSMFEPEYNERLADQAPARAAKSSVEAWEPPVAFSTSDLPEFPVEALPAVIGRYVSEVAQTSQVPPDLPAMLALSVVAACAARCCDVRVGETHTEPLNLWTAVISEPGTRKTSALELMVAPVRDAEREMLIAMTPEITLAKESRAIEEKRLAHLREAAAKDKSATLREQAKSDLCELAGSLTEVPAAPRLLADDVTQEKMASFLAEQGGCMAIFSAEGGVFGTLAGRYSQKSALNLDVYLKGHAGEDVRVDRVNRSSESIPRAMISMGLAVQPDVLHSLSNTPEFRGRGLLGRFLYAIPRSLIGSRMYMNRKPSEAAQAGYHVAVRELLAMLPPDAGKCEPGARHTLIIAGTALEAWKEFADETERRQREGGELSSISDWASKLAGAVARIAGGIHLVEHAGLDHPWRVPIDAESVLAAWAVGEYLAEHALAAFGQMSGCPSSALAQRVLRWILRDGHRHFTRRDCHQQHRSVSPPELDSALRILVEHGFIRLRLADTETGAGRPKGPTYDVNPLTQNARN